MRAAGPASALVIAALLSACGGESLPTLTTTTVEPPVTTAGAGSAYPETAAAPKDERFSPFSDASSTASGGREVIANPTLADIFAPGPLPEMSWGRTDAPVTIVEYASLTCPHCKRFHEEIFPRVKRELIDTGKVRFVLREFPIGKTSGAATIALRCAPPEKYLDLYGRFMRQQAKWVAQEVRLDPIFEVASEVGMTRAQFDACRENQAMIEGLKWVKDRGRKLGIIGTPNFFVGTRLVKSVLTFEEIKALTEPALSSGGAPASNTAGAATIR